MTVLPPTFNFVGLSHFVLGTEIRVGNSGGDSAVSSGYSPLNGKPTSDSLLLKKKSFMRFVFKVLIQNENISICGGDDGLVAKSRPTLETLWLVGCQAPLSMEFSRQEYWSG